MKAFLHWRGFDVPCASEIPNAGIVLAGRDRWQVAGQRRSARAAADSMLVQRGGFCAEISAVR
jgi:hypothetical protein